MAINYQVKQGDCIFSIAVEHGFFSDTIWNHENNAELKSTRKDPGILMPGDTVFVPDKRLKEVLKPTNEVHKFICKNTPKILTIHLLRVGKPVAKMEYRIDIDGVEKEGKTDSEGLLRQSISPKAKLAKILFADGSTFELKLGNMDPIDEVSGLQERLKNLSYYNGQLDAKLTDETNEALKIFQSSNDLEVTGEPDEETKALLVKLSGG